ncbi:uncharacterized protein K452DRAFT_302221 [Aplosporella prunicola CBS 121167]|uniref:Uncharacterized protein n=1 Tax=Aplosporella prunicola CBS 121167 TaxID=1176127 RepID=A0A6A6B0V0_9PEZI|nr:uncharacterized protein K452DRAFT_302221 [Aplosporella prunicola CBS 121167]KAF2137053.1 hypothetical protein K452DRAFT_302221 [Aplosporella prunicola CBS 121167]
MQLTNIAVALTLLTGTAVQAHLGCPGDYWYCGKCNGSSCKIGGVNYGCKHSTSCIGRGGGDGAFCGTKNDNIFNIGGDVECPVKK